MSRTLRVTITNKWPMMLTAKTTRDPMRNPMRKIRKRTTKTMTRRLTQMRMTRKIDMRKYGSATVMSSRSQPEVRRSLMHDGSGATPSHIG